MKSNTKITLIIFSMVIILTSIIVVLVAIGSRQVGYDAVKKKAYLTADIVKNSLTSHMVNGNMAQRDVFLDSISQLKNVQSLWLVRAKSVSEQFGNSNLANEKPKDEIDLQVLNTGIEKIVIEESLYTGNGISFIQTTEGYLQETSDIIQRIRELAVQSSNGIYTDEDRMQIQVEVSSLVAEVDRIASAAQFNGMNMLTGRFARPTGENNVTASMWLHIPANMDHPTQVFIRTMTATSLGLRNLVNEQIITLASPDDANRAIGTLDEALKKINKQRADLGAYQNRLEKTVTGLDVGAENLQASESRIRDTDMSKEMVDFTKNQILSQSGTAMIAQANQTSQNVLSLLK